MRRFNTTGLMIADQHYMVPIDRQVNAAAKMVEDGMYFTINRGRQYGKTTTLSFLQKHLSDRGYAVFSISFESLPDSKNQFVQDGQLDMRHLIERFSVHFNQIYRPEHDDRVICEAIV